MEDERDAYDAIRALDRFEFGRMGRRLRVEWTKQERGSSRRPESNRRSSSNSRPSKTLFVINFDPYHTRTRDLERHFDPYGKILNVRIRRNFAFIQFESQEEATKALDATNFSKLLDRVITVEYAVKDDDERRDGYSPDRRVRSRSPQRRGRESPDYGRGRGHSPSPYRRERASPDYARGPAHSPSRKERDSERVRGRSPSPKKERDSDYRRKRSPSPRKERETDYRRKRSLSPKKDIESDNHHNHNHSLSPRKDMETDNYHESSEKEKFNGGPNPENVSRGPSPSTPRELLEKPISPDDYGRDRSPAYSDGDSPPPDRYGSQSPGAGAGDGS